MATGKPRQYAAKRPRVAAHLTPSAVAASHVVGATVVFGLFVGPPAAPAHMGSLATRVTLLSADSPIGDLSGFTTALVMGGTGQADPTQQFVDTVDTKFLAPLGFKGTATPFNTPELLINYNTSMQLGSEELTQQVLKDVDAGQKVVVFGDSQSSAMSTYTMEALAAKGISADDVKFVLIGNSGNPNGGVFSSLNILDSHPFIPVLNVTMGTETTPNDLPYDTTVYTQEYDGWADFPRYALQDPLSLWNAELATDFVHLTYPDLTADQIAPESQTNPGGAILLDPGTTGSINYYMIPLPDHFLPLLEPLLLFGNTGQALYDLLEPDARILVNLGYGDIEDGWNAGSQSTPTPLAMFDIHQITETSAPSSTPVNLLTLVHDLVTGWNQGVTSMEHDLADPNLAASGNLYQNPALAAWIASDYASGFEIDKTPDTWQEFLGNFVVDDHVAHGVMTPITVDDLFGTNAGTDWGYVVDDSLNNDLTSFTSEISAMLGSL